MADEIRRDDAAPGSELENLPAKDAGEAQAEDAKGGMLNAFAQFSDIRGETTDKNHKGEIELVWYQI